MRRLIAILLVLAMLPVPAVFAREETPDLITSAEYACVEVMWQELEAVEERELTSRNASAMSSEPVRESTAQAVASEVEAHELYVEGSLRWQGDAHFTFETTVGVTCGYSARLRNLAMSTRQTERTIAPQTAHVSYGGESGKDVFVFQPYFEIDDSFTDQYQTEGQRIAKAIEGNYTLYTKEAATVDAIADAMEQGTVVVFDSHGETDYAKGEDYTTGATTSYLLLQTGAGLTTEDYANDNGTYHAVNYGGYGKMRYYAVDGTCVANHMDNPAQGGLLWMAICLGMATDGLHAPLMERGIAVSYGYSQSVTFGGDYCWEACFWDAMCQGAQVKDAIAEMKETYGCWDYSTQIYDANGWYHDGEMCTTIAKAIRDRRAFPIVVSAEDTYPGHGNVDNLQSVYSTWMLPLQAEYALTASSNDEALGTVSAEENVVIASPSDHAYIESYTLTPENAATVLWEGNTFTLSELTEDCHLTVNFARKPVLTASSSDETLGTVCVEGNMVTVSPADHAFVADYTLSPENAATVLREGNTFTVSEMTEDCHLTVNFTLEPMYTVNFSVPEGCGKGCMTGYAGESLSLGNPGGTPVADGEDYEFLGWTTAPVTDSPVQPEYFTDSFTLGQEDVTLYALYSYVDKRVTHYTTQLRMKVCYAKEYTDVNLSAWYHDALDFVLEEKIMNGTGNARFEPDSQLTRAMLATILYRMSGADGNYSHPFTDVEEGKWYSDAIAWAYESGVVNGTGATTFAPTELVTRQQAAAMLYRFARTQGQETEAVGDLSVFVDADKISDYAKLPLCWAVGAGVISGKGQGILDPMGTATRAEIAQIIYNWLS